MKYLKIFEDFNDDIVDDIKTISYIYFGLAFHSPSLLSVGFRTYRTTDDGDDIFMYKLIG